MQIICDSSAQNQSQVAKFGFKILSKNHTRGIFPIETLLQILILIYVFHMKTIKILIKEALKGTIKSISGKL